MESNPLPTQNPIDDRLRHGKSHCLSPILDESHTVSVKGLVSISFPFSFQFFRCLAAVSAEEVFGFEIRQCQYQVMSILLLGLTEISYSHQSVMR